MASQMSQLTRDDVLNAIFVGNDEENMSESDAGDSSNLEDDDETCENGSQIVEDACFRESLLNEDIPTQVSPSVK